MYTIKRNSVYQYEIKKSKFITLLYRVNDIDEVNTFLEQAKKLYEDATHYCFAYKIGNIQKFSDDGEPGGTAGLPIIDVLNKKELDYLLCVVVRYFGGIKLGASGLVRAYSKAVRNAIEENEVIELVKGYHVRVESNYDDQKQLDYLFSDQITKKDFQEKVIYDIEMKKEDIPLLQNYSYEIINEKWIERCD